MIYQLYAYQASNELTRQSLDFSKQSLGLTAQSVALTQQSISLSQKSLDLTQKSLEATQQQLKYAQQANDISNKSLAASLSSWVEVDIQKYKANGMGIEIDYTITNNSTQPAHKVMAQCVIEGWEQKMFDENAFTDSDIDPFVILPKQTVPYKAQMLCLAQRVKLDQVVKDIDSGKTRISVVVNYQDVLGNRSNYVVTLRRQGDTYEADEEYDAPRSKIFKIFGIPLPENSK